MNHQESILLTELFNAGKLSIRALHTCNALKLSTTKDLEDFIERKGDFLKIRNCGQKTKTELEAIYLIYKTLDKSFEQLPSDVPNISLKVLEDSPRFNKLLKTEFLKLSTRAQNCVSQLFHNNLPNINEFKARFIERAFLLGKQRNMGIKTFNEISLFIDRGIIIYNQCLTEAVTPTQSASLKFELATGINLTNIYHLELYTRNSFPLIEFCGENLSEILVLDKVEEFIFKNSFELLDQIYSKHEIAKKFNLSVERIRQISIRLKDEIPIRLKEKLSEIVSNTNYGFYIKNQEIVDFTYFKWDSFIESEISKYGKTFACYLLGILFSDSFYSLSKLDKLRRPVLLFNYDLYNSIKTINGFYLINVHHISKELLMNIYNLCVAEVINRQPKDKSISLVKFLKNIQLDNYKSTLSIISYILQNELKIEIQNEFIHIKRSTSKLVFEYAIEALEKLNRPSHISEIFSEILNQYPEFDSSEDSLKNSITRNKKIFIYFGRSSIYGLRVWEKEFKNIKGGTIRDIVEEFLNYFDEPCHISTIGSYVNKYRKTNEYSILTNLKIAGYRRFRFFKNGYVGLSSKDYQRSENIEKNKYQEISLEELLTSIFSK